MTRKARYYSDQEADEIVRICRLACKHALKQVREGLRDGMKFDYVKGRSDSMYGMAAAAIVFEFRAAPVAVEVDQIEESRPGAPGRATENDPTSAGA